MLGSYQILLKVGFWPCAHSTYCSMCLTAILTKSPVQYPWEPRALHYPLATDSDILQRKPEASPFISKDAVVRVLDPVLTLNMISQDLKERTY